MDVLGKQQRDIDELKKTQDNIHDLLQKRDFYPHKQINVMDVSAQAGSPLNHDASVDSSSADKNGDCESLGEVKKPLVAVHFERIINVVEENHSAMCSQTQSASVSDDFPTNRGIDIGRFSERASKEAPAGKAVVAFTVPADAAAQTQMEQTHSRHPSITDSVVSSLTGCTGFTGLTGLTTQNGSSGGNNNNNSTNFIASLPVSNNGNHEATSSNGSCTTPPRHQQPLQRLRFEAFLEAAKSYSPTYKFNSKFNFSPNFSTNNFQTNREMENMVIIFQNLTAVYLLEDDFRAPIY